MAYLRIYMGYIIIRAQILILSLKIPLKFNLFFVAYKVINLNKNMPRQKTHL